MEQQKPTAGAVAVARLCIRAVLQRPAAPPAACEARTWGSARSPRAGCGVGVGSAGTPGLCLCVGATGKTAVPCAVLRSCAAGSGVPGGYPGGAEEPKYSWLQGKKLEPAQGGGGCHGGHVCCGQMVAAFPRHEPIEAQRFASHLGTGLGTEPGDMGQERAPRLRARCPQRGHFRRQ